MAVKRRESLDGAIGAIIEALFTSPEATAGLAALDPLTVVGGAGKAGFKVLEGGKRASDSSFSNLLSQIAKFSRKNVQTGGNPPTSVEIDKVIRELLKETSDEATRANRRGGGGKFAAAELDKRAGALEQVLAKTYQAAGRSARAGGELAQKSSRPALLDELNSLAGATQRRRISEATRNSLTATALRGRDPFERFQGRNLAEAIAMHIRDLFERRTK